MFVFNIKNNVQKKKNQKLRLKVKKSKRCLARRRKKRIRKTVT